MKRCVILAALLLATSLSCWPQALVNGVQPSAVDGVTVATGFAIDGITLTAPGGGTFTLDSHCSAQDVGAINVSCTLATVSAGDLIVVEVENASGPFIGSVSDNQSQVYTQIWYTNTDGNSGMYYFQNSVADTSMPVTFAVSGVGGVSYIGIHAQAWKVPGPNNGALDTAFSPYFQVQSGSAANANCGAAKTPAGNGELIVGYVNTDTQVPTAGANYTFIDALNGPDVLAFPEYWIQTTATATNAPFVNAADDWVAGCAAFKP